MLKRYLQNNIVFESNIVRLRMYDRQYYFSFRICLSKQRWAVCIFYIFSSNYPHCLTVGFWLKHDTFYEQPDVRFQAEYLFYAATNNVSNPVFCSNFPNLQRHTCFDACNRIKVGIVWKDHKATERGSFSSFL